MSFELMNLNSSAIEKIAVNEIMRCNDDTAEYGLTLTYPQAIELAQTRTATLKATGRIEFGSGVIDKIIAAFCQSPYMSMEHYAETLHELVEIFYTYKNETLDRMGDDALIAYMRELFDEECRGSLELLDGKALDRIAKNIRYGLAPDLPEDDFTEEDEDEEDEY